MKKYYLKLKIKLILMLTLVLLLGTGFIVYQEADKIMWNTWENLDNFNEYRQQLRWDGAMDDEDFIQQIFTAYEKISLSSDVGFYSMVKRRNDNSTIAEFQNFILITRCENGQLTDDKRVILLEDDFIADDNSLQVSFMIEAYSTVDIIGTCDDTYIYLEELKWMNILGDTAYSYIPEDKVILPADVVRFEEWTGSTHFNNEWPNDPLYYIEPQGIGYVYSDIESAKKLKSEAQEICEQIYEDFANGTDTLNDQSERGLFTCVFANSGYLNDEYVMPHVYVYHPVSMAIKELAMHLILIGIMWFIMIFIISGLINKVYRQQLAHENNRLNLTRGIAHELKTPLAITKGYVENWAYVEEKDRKEYSKTMIDEIEHMNGMVMDLLELSRLEAKRKEPVFEQVELYSLTQSIMKRMNSIISEKGLVVTDKTQQGEYLVNADLEMMRTVLANFITNAIKYADREINLCIMSSEKKVRFVIINDGRTIPWNKVDKVWDEFYIDGVPDGTAGSTGAGDRLGSSGLGLAIAKNILVLHKAKYGCESNEKNTTFWFEMKRVSEE